MPPTYFLSMLWRRDDSSWHPVDTVSAEHPLDYVARAAVSAEPGYEFRLLFFCEIPLDVYERHRPPSVE